MNRTIERRKSERRDPAEPPSPEFLAVLEVCGGEMREGDRDLIARPDRAELARPVPAHDRRRNRE